MVGGDRSEGKMDQETETGAGTREKRGEGGAHASHALLCDYRTYVETFRYREGRELYKSLVLRTNKNSAVAASIGQQLLEKEIGYKYQLHGRIPLEAVRVKR